MRNVGRVLCAAVAVLLAAAGCGGGGGGGGDGGGPQGTGETVSATLGAAGGALTLEGATLTVPPGALAADTELTITSTTESPAGPFQRYSPVYRFAPDGTAFGAPVQVAIAFEGAPAAPRLYWTDADGAFAPVIGTVADGRVVAEVTHFSAGFAGEAAAAPVEDAGGGGGGADGAAGGGEQRDEAVRACVFSLGCLGIPWADSMVGCLEELVSLRTLGGYPGMNAHRIFTHPEDLVACAQGATTCTAYEACLSERGVIGGDCHGYHQGVDECIDGQLLFCSSTTVPIPGACEAHGATCEGGCHLGPCEPQSAPTCTADGRAIQSCENGRWDVESCGDLECRAAELMWGQPPCVVSGPDGGACDPSGFSCDGTTRVYCYGTGSRRFDCASLGLTCQPSLWGAGCRGEGSDPNAPCEESCEGDVLHTCWFGLPLDVDCSAYGGTCGEGEYYGYGSRSCSLPE